MINILIADDHNVIRSGIKALLDKEPTYNVVAEAVDGLSVLELLDSGIKADILLTDISMPGMDGLELVGNLQANYPQIKSIVLSAHDNEQYVAQAFRAGAAGYLLKSISADELIFAIKHVAKNNQYVASQLSTKILNRMLTVSDRTERVSPHGLEFSEKEVEVLELIAQGYTNQQIADKIFTGKRTVEGYRQGLIDKTGARNTAALVRFAVVNGIIN
ncbi:DNA-binding response regulator [Mucilaginibacter sp. PAMC 26640]|nr:DNA-binding response regulator [Mucilaginibacter sp. PAMC 26640]